MAYIFHEDKLPRLISAVPGRERTFFVNKELTKIDDELPRLPVVPSPLTATPSTLASSTRSADRAVSAK